MSPSIRFISAGAGSGKTHRLTELLYQELAAGRARPGSVLATTFTVRAATELRERVRGHLLRQRAFELANAIGQARIGTVNGVCGELLQRFAFEAGLPTEQRVLDERRAAALLHEAIDEVMARDALTDLLTVARRLCLAEGDKQGEEAPWRNALRELVGQARANGIAPDTLRTFGARNADALLAHFPACTSIDLDAALRNAIATARPALETAIAEKNRKNTREYLALLDSCLRDLDDDCMTWAQWNKLANSLDQKGPEAAMRQAVAPIVDIAGGYAAHPRLHQDLRRYLEAVFNLAADALQAYDARKVELGAVDFTDQECKLLDILDLPSVRETLGDELDLLMVDEFQDTSPLQLALFLKLATMAQQTIWVGDIKQAIYGFRGSDTALMQAVVTALPALGGTRESLTSSWRSRPSLVYLTNEIFGNAFEGLSPLDVALVPTRDEPPGMPALRDWHLAGGNKEAAMHSLASGVSALLSEGGHIVDRETRALRRLRASDVAVLMRQNEDVKAMAAALRMQAVPATTAQPGLLGRPECVLALACLRRLHDATDTIATAEILSLADCEEPEHWLADRLQWLAQDGRPERWRIDANGDPHPLLAAIEELRDQRGLLSPREALDLLIAGCGLGARAVQWQQDADRARIRLANLDRLLCLASEYEDNCHTTREAATIAGLLLWLQQLAVERLDEMARPAVDAVTVMTHHGAKGLEWPVVVLCDLAANVRDALWDVRAESSSAFEAGAPLRDRFLRYWPRWFGKQKTVGLVDDIAASRAGQRIRAAAVEESRRLLYVSMTRARDTLVLARPEKTLTGQWMGTISLDRYLPDTDDQPIVLANGTKVPFQRQRIAGEASPIDTPSSDGLRWFTPADAIAAHPPLTISPSLTDGTDARIIEISEIGKRISTATIRDREALGNALHACLAADLACPTHPFPLEEVRALLSRFGIADPALPAQVHAQLAAVRQWLRERWPEGKAIVELPITRRLPNGQVVTGRTDLLLRTRTGWILLDHKSTPAGSAQWPQIAQTYAGQLAAYVETIEVASGLPVEEVWLVLPVAGVGLRLGWGACASVF